MRFTIKKYLKKYFKKYSKKGGAPYKTSREAAERIYGQPLTINNKRKMTQKMTQKMRQKKKQMELVKRLAEKPTRTPYGMLTKGIDSRRKKPVTKATRQPIIEEPSLETIVSDGTPQPSPSPEVTERKQPSYYFNPKLPLSHPMHLDSLLTKNTVKSGTPMRKRSGTPMPKRKSGTQQKGGRRSRMTKTCLYKYKCSKRKNKKQRCVYTYICPPP